MMLWVSVLGSIRSVRRVTWECRRSTRDRVRRWTFALGMCRGTVPVFPPSGRRRWGRHLFLVPWLFMNKWGRATTAQARVCLAQQGNARGGKGRENLALLKCVMTNEPLGEARQLLPQANSPAIAPVIENMSNAKLNSVSRAFTLGSYVR